LYQAAAAAAAAAAADTEASLRGRIRHGGAPVRRRRASNLRAISRRSITIASSDPE